MIKHSEIKILEYPNGIPCNEDEFVIDRISKAKIKMNDKTEYILTGVDKFYIDSDKDIITLINCAPSFRLYNLYSHYYDKTNTNLFKVDEIKLEGTCVSINDATEILHFVTSFNDLELCDVDIQFNTDDNMTLKFKQRYQQ